MISPWGIEAKRCRIHIQKKGVSAHCYCNEDVGVELRHTSDPDLFELWISGEESKTHPSYDTYCEVDVTREQLIKLRSQIDDVLFEGKQ